MYILKQVMRWTWSSCLCNNTSEH